MTHFSRTHLAGEEDYVTKTSAVTPSRLRWRSRLGMVGAETEPVQLWSCRNLSLIVPLCGLDGLQLQTEFVIGVPHLCGHAASNETYSCGRDISSWWRRMEGQLPS